MFIRKATAVLLGAILILWSATAFAAQPNDAIVLNPDGNYVDIILHNMIQVRDFPNPGDDYRGSSINPADEYPSDIGYVFLESIDYGPWRRDIYVTPDAINLEEAFAVGGTIILNPGTYYFSARSSWYFDGVWSDTSMDYRVFDAEDRDFVLLGAESDKNGPKAKIITDQFLHIGADRRWLDDSYMYYPAYWHEIKAVNQTFDNIAFDNSKYIAFREGRSDTLVGQIGKANLTFENCTFTGGGLTFHTVGSMEFIGNTIDALYGVHLTSSVFYYTDGQGNPQTYVDTIADADALISGNKIRTKNIGVYIDRNSYLTPDVTQTRSMEIVGNEIEFSNVLGIGVEFTPGEPVIHHNKIMSSAYHGNPSGFFGIFGGIELSGGATDTAIQPQTGGLVKNNEIILNNYLATPFSAISLFGRGEVTVQSNKVIGTSNWPIWLTEEIFQFGGEANSNVIKGNNLKQAVLEHSGWFPPIVPPAHIFFSFGADYNVVYGGGASGNNIVVYDLVEDLFGGETHNLVVGADHQVGLLTRDDPNYLSMQEAMNEKFAQINQAPWKNRKWSDNDGLGQFTP